MLYCRDGNISSPGCTGSIYNPQPVSELSVGPGFHTVRGGFDPSDHRFLSRVVKVVDAWRDFGTGDKDISSPGAGRSWRFPNGYFPLQAPRHLIRLGRARRAPRQMGLGPIVLPGIHLYFEVCIDVNTACRRYAYASNDGLRYRTVHILRKTR